MITPCRFEDKTVTCVLDPFNFTYKVTVSAKEPAVNRMATWTFANVSSLELNQLRLDLESPSFPGPFDYTDQEMADAVLEPDGPIFPHRVRQ